MTCRATLGVDDLTVLVEAPDHSTLTWLREFAGPDFDEREGRAPDVTIRAHADDAAYETLRSAGPHPAGGSIECFAFDHHVEALPKWRAESGQLVVHDAALNACYVRDPGGHQIELYSPARNLSARLALLRVLRELAMAHRLRREDLLLHAAAVEWRGRAIAIAGPKKAGKTTLTLHLLHGTGSRFIANDRAAVSLGPAGVSVRGIPTIVRVRASSLDHLPALRQRFQSSPFHHRWLMAEAERRRVPSQRSSYDLTPAQLVRLLHAERSGETPLAAVVFPRQTGGRGVAVTELTGSETASRLRSSLFRARDTTVVGEFFAGELVMSNRDAACARVAEKIVGLECALGVDAYAEAGAASDLLRAFASYSVPTSR